ncbi:MAG: hypothetical protein CMJ49_13150 [Planctomycetaceae bacterium]|nr:hypothetical protein [Planctomycetaceae bacterium]
MIRIGLTTVLMLAIVLVADRVARAAAEEAPTTQPSSGGYNYERTERKEKSETADKSESKARAKEAAKAKAKAKHPTTQPSTIKATATETGYEIPAEAKKYAEPDTNNKAKRADKTRGKRDEAFAKRTERLTIRHERRLARLQRIHDIAVEQGNDKVVQRVIRLQEREAAHFMKILTKRGGNR